MPPFTVSNQTGSSILNSTVSRDSYRSPDELVAAIESFIERWNSNEAHPFRWTYEGLPLVR